MNPSSGEVNILCRTIDASWRTQEASLTCWENKIFLETAAGREYMGEATKAALKSLYAFEARAGHSTTIPDGIGWDIRDVSVSAPACGIVEVIDECEVKCATCIANSLPGTGNQRSVEEIYEAARHFSRSCSNAPIMLSGGEPTLHKNLIEIVSQLSSLPNPIYLITNGIKISRDKSYARALQEADANLTVYLQFDSTDTADIHKLRTQQMDAPQRERAIEACEYSELGYVLVSVIARGINDDKLGAIYDRHFDNPCLKGLTFQPIKMEGRHEFATSKNELTRFEVDELVRTQIGAPMFDHPENPLNWSSAQFNGGQWSEKQACKNMYTRDFEGKHITVIWHTSHRNYVLESCYLSPVAFLQKERWLPLEIHYA